ncbi:hypothetical protein [Adlercreutzia sp. ZJ304]|uniref:hypothetical protein n=1 Tax=Adlercreutzia sp. ZJ304 TaxID=2709791 RepID=UPI0013EACBE2|nr:hypothetical protein [Adlercreutzia sp. ZJ304]
MSDIEKCDSLSHPSRKLAADILGRRCVKANNKFYADTQLPSYARRKKANTPAGYITREDSRRVRSW